MRLSHFALSYVFLVALTVVGASARAEDEQRPANEQVVQPQVERRPIKLPKFPSNDIELGAFVGTYATQNFGSSLLYGARLGYHITEDIFVEAAYGRTKVSDENFRRILPSGIFPNPQEKLYYYNLSAGYNILPGELFAGRRYAMPAALYVMAGVGATKFLEQRRQTVNVGLGLRVFMKDWAAIQVDMKDHIYSLDLLGKRQNTQNIEFTAGLAFFF